MKKCKILVPIGSYKNKEWLEDQYWNKELSIKEIAKKCNVSYGCIWKRMNKFGIKRREKRGTPGA